MEKNQKIKWKQGNQWNAIKMPVKFEVLPGNIRWRLLFLNNFGMKTYNWPLKCVTSIPH